MEPQPEVATKAPESDANSQSIFPNDSPAQHGATMGASLISTTRPNPCLLDTIGALRYG